MALPAYVLQPKKEVIWPHPFQGTGKCNPIIGLGRELEIFEG